MCFLCPSPSSSSPWSARRAFLLAAGAATGSAALAQVDVGKASQWRKLVPADKLEAAAAQQYVQTIGEARTKGELVPDDRPQVQRLRAIAKRMIPRAPQWNKRAAAWNWEVNLIQSDQINAYCMPGGKIVFYTAILDALKLSDDEAAMIMGHEMAHALREHGRERIGKSTAASVGISFGAQLFGLGDIGNLAAKWGAQLLTLKFGREDESEADLVGLELAARSAYDPKAGATLWRKMTAASGNTSTNFLSTHPSGPERIRQLEVNAPKVQGLYDKARKGA